VGPRRASVESQADDDPLEREAQRTARDVMSATVAPRCACGGVAGADGECPACRARRLGAGSAAPRARGALSGPGRPLDVATRAFFEPRLRADLGAVRVHDDARAASLAQEVGADAFTFGRDMVFGAGRYRPASDSGRTLIAHELAHVVQQQSGRTSARIQRQARSYTFVPAKASMTPYEVLVQMVMTARGVTEGQAIDLIAAGAFGCGAHPACLRGVHDRTPILFTLGSDSGATRGSVPPKPAPPQTEQGVAWLPEETIIVTGTAPTAAVEPSEGGAIDDYPGAREALDSPAMRRLYGLRDKYYRLYPQLRQAASLDPSADDVVAMIEVSEIVKGFDETDWTLLETRVGTGAVATDWQQLRSALSQFAGGSARAGARAATTRREKAIAAADLAVDRPAETSAVQRLDDTEELYRIIRSVEFIEGLPKQRGQGPNPELAREQGIERELLAKAQFGSVAGFDQAVQGLRTAVRREAVALTLHLLKESEAALVSEHERYREPAERRQLMKDIAATRGGRDPVALWQLISRHWLLTTSKNLSRALDSDNADLLGDVLLQSAQTQLDNVARCRDLLADDQEVVFDFDKIIELTLEQMGIKPDSVQARLIHDERAKPDRRSAGRTWIDRLFTVLSFVPGPIGWVFRAAQFGLSINDIQSHYYQQVIAANAGTPLASQPTPGGSLVDIVLNLVGLIPGGGDVAANRKAIAEFAKALQETDAAVASGAATEAKLLAGAHEPPAPQPPPVREVPTTEPPALKAAREPPSSPSELPTKQPRKKIARPANYRDPDTGVRSGMGSGKPRKPASTTAPAKPGYVEVRIGQISDEAPVPLTPDPGISQEVDVALDKAAVEGSFVQGGETYHNERAVEALRTEAIAKLESDYPALAAELEWGLPRPAATSTQPLGVTAQRVENAVEKSKEALKKRGVSGLDPALYGSKLHTELRTIAESRLGRRLKAGTEFFNDRTVAEIKNLSKEEANVKVADWLTRHGLDDPGLSPKLLNERVGSLKPDLAFREPGGAIQVIDLTGQPDPDHLAKTILYTLVLGVP